MWIDPATINGGQEYTEADGVTVDDFNTIIEDLKYLAENEDGGGLIPVGTKYIDTNGVYDVASYASVNVAVSRDDFLLINGELKKFKVGTSATISAGDFVEYVNKIGKNSSGDFSVTTTSMIQVCRVSYDKIVIAYVDEGNNNSLAMRVLQIADNGDIVLGTPLYILYDAATSINEISLTSGDIDQIYLGYVLSSGYLYIDVYNVFENLLFSYVDRYGEHAHRAMTSIAIRSIQPGLVFARYGFYTSITSINYYAKLWQRSSDYTYNISNIAAGSDAKVLKMTDNRLALFSGGEDGKGDPLTLRFGVITLMQYNEASPTIAYDPSGSLNYYSSYSVCKLDNEFILLTGFINATVEEVLISRFTAQVIHLAGSTLSSISYKVIEDCNYISSPLNALVTIASDSALAIYKADGAIKARYLHINSGVVTSEEPVTILDADTEVDEIAVADIANNIVTVAYTTTPGASQYINLAITGTSITIIEDSPDIAGAYVSKATASSRNIGVAKTSGATGDIIEVYCVK